MERTNVISSSIKSIGHDGTHLEVQFANGGIYSYSGVPYDLYQKLRVAPSIGSAFTKEIVKGGFKFKKLA